MRAVYIKTLFFLSFTPYTPTLACVCETPRGKEVKEEKKRAAGRYYAAVAPADAP